MHWLDLVGWVGQSTVVFGTWQLGKKNPKGFLAMLFGNVGTVIVGCCTEPRLPSYVVAGVVFFGMNSLAFWRWRKHERREAATDAFERTPRLSRDAGASPTR